MSTRKPLVGFSAFGNSMEGATILSGHPDERFSPDGDYVPDARTLLLRLNGNKAVYLEEYAFPLNRSWMSNNGTVYCTGVRTDSIFIRRNGIWRTETFSQNKVEYVNGIFGVSAEDTMEDQLYMTTSDRVFFTRIGGRWSRHVPPERVTLLRSPYGTKPDEIYVGGNCLFLWNGTQLEQLQAPETDSLSALFVTSDDRLIGGKRRLHISNEDGGWDTIETSYSRFTHICEFQGSLYAATLGNGIIRIYPGKPEAVTQPLEINFVLTVIDGLIALGDTTVLASFDGTEWFQVRMPICERYETFR